MNIPFIIYADTKYLLEKIQTCDSNPQYSCTVYFTAKTGKIITIELETL